VNSEGIWSLARVKKDYLGPVLLGFRTIESE
jgi:hypothetical protein